MLVYAFFGMGKTTLSEMIADENIIKDMDSQYFGGSDEAYKEAVLKYQDEHPDCAILVNGNPEIFDLQMFSHAFLPVNAKLSSERLRMRGVDKFFLHFIEGYDGSGDLRLDFIEDIFEAAGIPVERLNEDQYLSDYKDIIIPGRRIDL